MSESKGERGWHWHAIKVSAGCEVGAACLTVDALTINTFLTVLRAAGKVTTEV